MAFLSLPLDQIILFLFVLVRVSAILFVVPFFDSRSVPTLLKVSLAVAVTWLLVPQLEVTPPDLFKSPVRLALGLAAEVAIGLIIGLIVQLLFAGIQLAGQMAGFQMGFAIANVVDPASSMQIPMLSQFMNVFALLIFLSLNVHFYFIRALVDGFELIPLWGAHFEENLFHLVMKIATNAFVVAVQVGAPVMVALLLTSVALGLIARTVPQMQIFIVAMPLKILLGLLFLGLSLPFCTEFLKSAFGSLGQTIQVLIRMLA
jgi:flagellar biosynthetic protein FliR